MTLSDKQFQNEFDVNHNQFLDIISKVLKCEWINTQDMLLIAGKIISHVEEI